MLMSFASYHLWLPWRHSGLASGAPVCGLRARHPLEPVPDAVGQHSSINTVRVYNPIKQGRKTTTPEGRIHSPLGALSSTWCRDVYVHEPWELSMAAQRQAGLQLGVDCPLPMVEPALAAREAKQTDLGDQGALWI